MNKKWSRTTFGMVAGGLVIAIGLLSFWVAPEVAAQNESDPWLSSVDPPEGTSIEALSPPDQPGLDVNRSDGEPEGRAVLISQRIAGSALRPRDSVVDFNISSSGGCIYAVNNASDVFNTPIWLPQGATVDTLRMYYYDTSGSNSAAWFSVYDLYGDIVEEWNVSSTGDLGNSFNDSAQISHTIDYSVYSYLLNWRPGVAGTTMQLCGFRIFVEPPPLFVQFVPSFMK